MLTGFLGAGKTTIVNRLLARRAATDGRAKLAVIVNELGQVGIDGRLLADDSTKQVELPGGCVCCALGDELDRTLIDIAATPDLEAILLETTGAAEPIPIAWAADREPVVQSVRMTAVVTVVDAVNVVASRDVSDAVDAQIAYADVVLVTKADVASAAELEGALAVIAELAPRALVRRGTTSDHAAWLDEILRDPDIAALADRPVGEPHVHDDACRHLDSDAHGIDSVWAPFDGVADLEDLEDRLASLPRNYVRIKGILRAIDHREGTAAVPQWYVIHRVGLRVSSERLANPKETEDARVVALGPGVRRDDLVALLHVS